MKKYDLFIILSMVIIVFLMLFVDAGAQPNGDDDGDNTYGYGPPMPDIDVSFRPSVAVVIGILSFMFALTFLLLIYAKFCHIASGPGRYVDEHGNLHHHHHHGPIPTRSSRFSGIDKTLIESLPFFKFSTLKGSKQGLECAVCLSKFEDSEILRLLPKCKHAFHQNCVDQWLESHSSCPLCRHKIHADDVSLFKLSNSARISRNSSSLDLREDPNIELFVRREQDVNDHHVSSSSRFSIGSRSFRKENGKKDDELEEFLLTDQEIQEIDIHQDLDDEDDCDNSQFHKFNHKIIISDIVYNNRWSDVNSSDLMFLNSEMLNIMSSNRFSSLGTDHHSNNISSSTLHEEKTSPPTTTTALMKIRQEIEMKRLFESKISSTRTTTTTTTTHPTHSSLDDFLSSTSTSSNFMISSTSNKRCMSEITNISRFRDHGMQNNTRDSNNSSSASASASGSASRLWLPIARRTVEWIGGRERRPPKQSDQNSRLFSIV